MSNESFVFEKNASTASAEEKERSEAAMRELHRANYINCLRAEAFGDIPADMWRFEKASATVPLAKAKDYADKWDEYSRENIGLLMFGPPGTGKSYAAGCIANALIERMISVLFVDVHDVVNRMSPNSGIDYDAYVKRYIRPDLLILDDLGAERSTSYARERVCDVVNRRLLSGKPLIITTNIPPSAMGDTTDQNEMRIYQRILAACVPVLFHGENFRQRNAAEKLKRAVEIFNS